MRGSHHVNTRVTATAIAASNGVVCVRQYARDGDRWLVVAEAGDLADLTQWHTAMALAGSLGTEGEAESTVIRFDDRHGIAVVRDPIAQRVAVAVYMPSAPAIKSLRRRLRALNLAHVLGERKAAA